MHASNPIILGRLSDERQGEVDLVVHPLHHGQDQLLEAVLGVRTLAHDVRLQRDQGSRGIRIPFKYRCLLLVFRRHPVEWHCCRRHRRRLAMVTHAEHVVEAHDDKHGGDDGGPAGAPPAGGGVEQAW